MLFIYLPSYSSQIQELWAGFNNYELKFYCLYHSPKDLSISNDPLDSIIVIN
jgi:hypothetical protein